MALPAIADDSGYLVTVADLETVGVSVGELQSMQRQERPLGMTRAAFAFFVSSLADALATARATDADVRLQGTAAWWFSGPHKAMPADRDALMQIMVERHRGRVPYDFELDDVEEHIESLWPSGTPRPRRPFFDLLHRLHVDPVPSDVDVQISSDVLVDRARQLATQRRVSLDALQTEDRNYRFLLPKIVDQIAHPLQHWADDQTAVLGRVVAIKVFGSSGPPNTTNDRHAVKSSHFGLRDWVVHPASPVPAAAP